MESILIDLSSFPSTLSDKMISDVDNASLSETAHSIHSRKKKISKQKFEWTRLDKIWDKVLLTDSFIVKDCVGDGNCQFRSIEEALKNEMKVSHKKLRQLTAKYITSVLSDEDFKQIIQNYRIERENQEFIGKWDPFAIKTKTQFAREVKKDGFHFEGDNITLSLLSKVLETDFVIFSQLNSVCNINELSSGNDKFIILLYKNIDPRYGHYQTIGLRNTFKGKNITAQTLFRRNQLPEELRQVVSQDSFYSKHVNNFYLSSKNNFTLNNLYNHIIDVSGSKISKKDKQIISKHLREIIKHLSPKHHAIKIKTRKPKSSEITTIKKSSKASSKRSIKRSSKRSVVRSRKASKRSIKRSSKRPRRRISKPKK